jgi:hypothetical protein
VQRGLALDDAALDVLARVRPRVALDHVDAFDDQAVLVRHHLQHAPALAAVLAGHHEHVVVLRIGVANETYRFKVKSENKPTTLPERAK